MPAPQPTFSVLWEPTVDPPRNDPGGGHVHASTAAGALGPYTVAVVAVGTGLGNVALFHSTDLPFMEGEGAGTHCVLPLEAGHQIGAQRESCGGVGGGVQCDVPH